VFLPNYKCVQVSNLALYHLHPLQLYLQKQGYMKRYHLHILIIALFSCNVSIAQDFPEKDIAKKLKADKIEMDAGNGDGVFKARLKKTKKWGMYQYTYSGTKVKELIPMQYDSVRYFPFNGSFAAVYNDGKVGFYLSEWSYGDQAKQTVPCSYGNYQRYNSKGTTYLAVTKNNKWGWVDWLTGEEKSEFKYTTKKDLPSINYKQETWFKD
jgi:hypothetical protein